MEEENFLERPVVLDEQQISEVLMMAGAWRTKRQGNNIQSSHCMLHGNNSPTLGICIDAPHEWNCFSCGKGGRGPDIVSFVERAMKISRKEAFAVLAEKFGIGEAPRFSLRRRLDLSTDERPRFVLSPAALAAYPLSVKEGIGYRAAKWYLGIDPPMADKFKLGYRLSDHRLVFPVFHEDGALGGLIGRSMVVDCPHENRWRNFDAEAFKRETVMMGMELPVDPDKPMIVVEGPRDFFKIRSFGWDNVRATLGASMSEWQLERLKQYELDVVPLYDEDRAGEAGRRKLRKALSGHVHVLSHSFPPEAVDPEKGKGDPAMLTPELFQVLVQSFRRSFNFARLKT